MHRTKNERENTKFSFFPFLISLPEKFKILLLFLNIIIVQEVSTICILPGTKDALELCKRANFIGLIFHRACDPL